MKNILFIAPHAFPIKSSESICNAKVAYALASAGYNVHVYTCNEPSTYPEDTEMTQLLSTHKRLKITEISPDYIIKRSDPLCKIFRSVLYNIGILLQTGYFYNSISVPFLLLKQILHDIKISGGCSYDVVITRGFGTDLAGVELVKKYGLKWIANWNDPYPLTKFPPPYGDGPDTELPYFSRRLYIDIQKMATIHTFPNNRLRNYMLNCFKAINIEQTTVVPHMALRSLFKCNTLNDGKLRFIHCGDLKKPRSPREFLYALSKYIQDYPEDIDIIECNLIGGIDNDIPSLIEDLALIQIVNLKKGLSYKDALEEISKCNVSLIIEAKCDEGIYLPTKVVDSLQCGVNIFAISPDNGVLKDYIKSHAIGYYALNTSIEDIYLQIKRIIQDFKNNIMPVISVDSCPEIYDDAIIGLYRNIIEER